MNLKDVLAKINKCNEIFSTGMFHMPPRSSEEEKVIQIKVHGVLKEDSIRKKLFSHEKGSNLEYLELSHHRRTHKLIIM